MAWSPNGKWLAVGADDAAIVSIRDAVTLEEVVGFDGKALGAYYLQSGPVFDAKGERLAVGLLGVMVWELSEKENADKRPRMPKH